ncbi:hypothetical protein P8452_33953 [Trifolium repens]|nr:hypothetical protein QL285_023025 [Trifolium repens]WJX47237.1 hypothetical protein P8452_33953 [Trifolium repens]
MIEILEKVGDNIMEVIVHADGSLKEEVSVENYHKAHNRENEKEQQEYATYTPDIVMDTCETEDRKPFRLLFLLKTILRMVSALYILQLRSYDSLIFLFSIICDVI